MDVRRSPGRPFLFTNANQSTSIAPLAWPWKRRPAALPWERTLSVTTLSMKGEFHEPDLDSEIFPGEEYGHILFDDVAGGWFALDRLMLVRILMAAVLVIFFVLAMRNPKVVPRGVQNVAEIILDFVRVNIVESTLGKKEGKRFFPLIAIIFVTVLALNLSTVIPGLNVSSNARIGMPIVLAITGYVAMIYAGAKRYGFFKYLKSSIVVPNVPWVLHIMLVPIEILSTFIVRPVTLAIRLMANMLAGHLILVLLFSATNFFFWQLNGWTALSGVTVLAGVVFTAFELFIVGLQAYIFALLVSVYIDLSLHADEH